MRAAIYARFSSDLQNPKSADDQIVECRRYVEREGGSVVLTFKDEAVSGASIENRPQLQALLTIAGNGVVDAVIVESLDRLSRSVGDLDNIRRRLVFHKIKLISLADGEANHLTVGLRGIIGAAYLEDLRQKTKRGQLAALKAGKVAGGRCYGYDVVPGGKGERTINDEQADVVRRIFREYAAGRSADEIVRALNAERVPSPRGQAWRANTLLGSQKDKTGLLRNELYSGVFVFNRHEFVKSPDTGQRIARHNDESLWLRQPMPKLRLVDDETWDAVQQRLAARSASHKSAMASGRMARKPPRLLSGLLRCACGGAIHIVRDGRAQCIEAKSGACSNTRMISMADIEARVVQAIRNRLLSPEIIEAALTAAREEMAKLREAENRQRRALERELQDLNRKLAAQLRAIEDGAGDVRAIVAGMRIAESRKDEVEAALATVPEQKIELHPHAVQRYRRAVDALWSYVRRADDAVPGRTAMFLNGRVYEHSGSTARAAEAARQREQGQEELRQGAREALRSLIERVVVAPDGEPTDARGGGAVTVTVHGQLATLLAMSDAPNDVEVVHRVVLVAGAGFEPTTFRL
ncbi:recombinase family protein [Hyphomicrobium sulfonivorans]|uniref:recombinase family protein n=1 Tax=Hyphomicrobium sulfonivorans TaxID=121290 RepID=UPI003AAF7C86